jgi:hypothetical protein
MEWLFSRSHIMGMEKLDFPATDFANALLIYVVDHPNFVAKQSAQPDIVRCPTPDGVFLLKLEFLILRSVSSVLEQIPARAKP